TSLSLEQPEIAINKGVSDTLVTILAALPHGVLAMSRDVEGLVETSNNIGVIAEVDETIEITCTFRSSVNASKIAIKNQIVACAKLAGAQYKIEHEYPGWTPNLKSKILKIALDSYQELFDATGISEAKHAGLETGILMDKIPGLDVISFGPDIMDAHSVKERVHIGSVEKHFTLLKKVLEKVANEYC
ncbi:M20/M25/M40 family metallo-hydrolase, partial [bacterium]|nr:M20/M25/M40 family metallo-hydrolase [bacterium]MBU1026090.1 M20/M25/M40 family metallo-hydrolase [bacterium]